MPKNPNFKNPQDTENFFSSLSANHSNNPDQQAHNECPPDLSDFNLGDKSAVSHSVAQPWLSSAMVPLSPHPHYPGPPQFCPSQYSLPVA